MDDKKFGYIILALLFCTIISILVYSIWVLAFPKETRIIAFHQISNLRIDDPVKIEGVTVAIIKNITKIDSVKNDKQVLVTIKTFEPLTVYEGYKIFSTDKGILGDRVIVFENGNKNNPIIDKNDTLTGIFYRGVSDVLGSAWKLKDLVISFKTDAGILLSGSPEKPSFVSTFSNIISEIDSFSTKLYNAAAFINAELTPKIDTLNSFVASAKNFSDELTTTVPENMQTLKEQVEILSNFMNKLDNTVNTLTDIVIQIRDNKLLHIDYVTKLVEQLEEIRDIIAEIQDGTARLRLRVKFGF